MPRHIDLVFLACCAASLLCMPLLIAGGLMVLVGYSVLGGIGVFAPDPPQLTDARESAQRLCCRIDGE